MVLRSVNKYESVFPERLNKTCPPILSLVSVHLQKEVRQSELHVVPSVDNWKEPEIKPVGVEATAKQTLRWRITQPRDLKFLRTIH